MSNKDEHHHTKHCSGKSFNEIAIEALKQAHHKITRPRLAVIRCLDSASIPLSPKTIFEQISLNKETKVNQVSVYRILESLVKIGVVHKIFPSGDYVPCHTSCEKTPSHVITNCVVCHSTTEIHLEWSLIESIYNKIKTDIHFKPLEHIMQINGLCARCQ